jgi:hypothetical protein
MGQEARCVVRVGDTVSEGKASLETDELVFRGDHGLRLKVPFREIRSVEVTDGELRFESPDGLVALGLGVEAAKWADKILHPKSVLDKLGVKAGMRVLVLGVEDAGFLTDLRERTDDVVLGETSSSARPTSASGRAGRNVVAESSGAGYDLIFVAVNEPLDLERLPELKRAIKPDGAVWAVFRKGRKDFNENDVLRGGLDAGLVDVKVVRFSDTHTASKFVIRKAERGQAGGTPLGK